MSKLRTVVFTGELLPDVDPEDAISKFASVFKVPEDKARRLIKGGQEKALKKDVDPTAAAHYRDVLADIGLKTRIDEAAGSSMAGSGEPCPKCGSTRVENGVCKSCGILVEAYLANRTAERKAGAEPGPLPEPPAAPGASTSSGPSTPPPGSPAFPETQPLAPGAPQPRSVPLGHALGWIGGGWALFKQAPVAWVGALVVFLLLNLVLALVPAVGGLITTLIAPVLIGGFMSGAYGQDQKGIPFQISHLFAGFSVNTASLFAIGGLYLLGSLVVGLLVAAILIGPMMSAAGGMNPEALDSQSAAMLLESMGPTAALAVLVALALILPLVMAYWFAPALVMLNGLDAFAAMKLSFSACVRNILPFLLYGLIGAVLMVIAMIPFFLGLLILSPVFIASMYVSYRDIFFDAS